MSRIGNQPITLPSNVNFTLEGKKVTVSGPLGTLTQEMSNRIIISQDGQVLVFKRKSNAPVDRAAHGLVRALVNNMVEGVTKGFQKNLELVGTGYRVTKVGSDLSLTVGFSHPVVIKPEPGITLDVEGNNKIFVKGIDKHMVGQIASNIRKVHPPEPYKGKGVRYEGEVVRRKAGKAAKAGA
jgi:large subunit ribosomal protein L6